MTWQDDEVSECGGELMEIDISNSNNGCVREIRENGLLLYPVLPHESGKGLPYAPENWPNPGDIWGWKVGKRMTISGFFMDRYMYLPLSLQKARCKRDGFASRLSVVHFVKERFPGVDVNSFFSSFSWKIPSKQAYLSKDKHDIIHVPSEELVEQSPSDSVSGTAVCKAGNRFCLSLLEEDVSSSTTTQSCDICCSESSFCRECCCILCCKTVDLAFGGYSFIRCRAATHDGLICGHAAHIKCALRSYMAGTVGGSVGLDTEYYCRRCDSRTDLIEHVVRLVNTCESISSRDNIERMLNVGASLLRGSQKRGTQKLLNHIETAFQKLKDGSNLDDVWKTEVCVTASTEIATSTQCDQPPSMMVQGELDHSHNRAPDIEEDNLSRENEIDRVLRELQKSQEIEYRIAEERLHAQKDYTSRLSQQVKEAVSELKMHTKPEDRNALLSCIALKEENLRRALGKLKDMEKVSKGFGKTPKYVLKEHFDVHIDDEDQFSYS